MQKTDLALWHEVQVSDRWFSVGKGEVRATAPVQVFAYAGDKDVLLGVGTTVVFDTMQPCEIWLIAPAKTRVWRVRRAVDVFQSRGPSFTNADKMPGENNPYLDEVQRSMRKFALQQRALRMEIAHDTEQLRRLRADLDRVAPPTPMSGEINDPGDVSGDGDGASEPGASGAGSGDPLADPRGET